MENGRFVVLTGHLSEYPLSDVVGILRHQRKTGRLLIEYPKGPAALFFQQGELVDAQLNQLSGLQAICVALSEPPSAFNFNPLISSSHRSIDTSLQRVVSELLGCWDESALEIEVTATGTLPKPEPLTLAASTSSDFNAAGNLMMLAPGPISQQRWPTNRTVLMMASAGLLMAALSTVIAVTGGLKRRADTESAASKAAPAIPNTAEPLPIVPQIEPRKNTKIQTRAAMKADAKTPRDQAANTLSAGNSVMGAIEKKDKTTSAAQSINVVMQIENGRVLKASIADHKAGMENYEALALRIARQRRYPSKGTGQETVRITVTQPN
jgi:hypothetical protein